MGNNQNSSLEVAQRVFQHLFGRDVEMVGGFIQHQQVAGAEKHQGQSQACLFAAAELAHLLEHRVVAEAEVAQQRADLGLGPVRDGLEHRVDDRFVQVQGFGLVLFEVAGHNVVFTEPGRAVIRRLHAHHQAQQG